MLALVAARFRRARPPWSTGAVGGIDNPCAGGAGAGATEPEATADDGGTDTDPFGAAGAAPDIGCTDMEGE